MSKTVDERVVSMKFDNQNFEKNVQTSMSTLEKLKAKLNLSGASKGLEQIDAAARKVNFSGISGGIDAIIAKFSTLQVMGVTAIANLTNSAVNAGKSITKALTLDPITMGFKEYETQINAVQTILANTQHKGSTIDDVNKALDELNKYADQTIYNFTEMTRNIGTFTAAGVDLEKSVTSIKGIANLAAISGSNATQASTAMYQLSQALATGKVSLQDWNSVVNAGMGGQLFQNALKRTATQMGYNVDFMIEKYGSFRASLTEGAWLTTEVLTETLTQLSGAYTEADLIAQGYSEEQAREIYQLSQTAVDAATKVKTFTQLFDTMKEAMQSGWTQTWELIIGDFEEAKELLTSISNFFGALIQKSSDKRNNLLKGALENNPFSELTKRIEKVTGVTEEMTKATQKYGEIVDKVIGGQFGNGQTRIEKLTEAGYDWAYVQNLVNERLGDSTRHATDYKEAQEAATEAQKYTVEGLIEMSEAQLKSIGFTESEVKALKDLGEQSKKTGIPIQDLLKDMDQLNGRTLLINSFKNAAQGLVKVFSSVEKAYQEMFPPMQSDQLYNMIAGLHKLSTYLIMSDSNADKLYRTFRGLFAIFDMVTTLIGGGFKMAFKIATSILNAFGVDASNVLDVTAKIGDFLYDLNQKFNSIGDDLIKGLVNGIVSSPVVEALITLGQKMLDAIKGVLGIHSPSTEMFDIGYNVILGLLNGMKSGLTMLLNTVKGIAAEIKDIFEDVNWGKVFAVGISVAFLYTIIKLAKTLEGLISPLEGVGNVLGGFSNALNSLAFSIKANAIKSLAISLAILVGSVFLLTKMDVSDLWGAIGALAALAAIVGLFSAAMAKFGPKEALNFGGFSLAVLAISSSLLLMSFALRRLEKTDPDKLPLIIAGFTTVVLALVGVLSAYSLLTSGPNTASIEKAGGVFLKLSASLLIMTQVIRIMSGMSAGDIAKGSAAITAFVGIFALLATVTTLSKDVSSLGSNLLKMSVSMLILVAVIKLVSGLSAEEVLKGAAAILAFVGIFALLALITKLAGSGAVKGLGTTLLAMSASILIMALVIKLISGLSASDIAKGIVALVAFTGIIALLVSITRLAQKETPKMAATLLAMSVSIGILAGIAVLLSLIDISGLTKGIVAVGLLSSFMALMIYATRGVNDVKGNLVVMSIAIGIMAAAVAGLSLIDTSKLASSTAALSTLMLSFAAMSKLSGSMTASVKTLITMSVVVGLLSSLLYVLGRLEIDSAIQKSVALSMMILSFSASIKLLDNFNGLSARAMVSIVAMTAVLSALAGILWLIRDLPVESTLANAASLSVLLLSLSVSLGILDNVNGLSNRAMASVAVMAGLVAALAGILWLIQDLPVESTLANAAALSVFLLSFSASVAILSVIGTASAGAIAGAGSMVAVVAIIGALLAALAGLTYLFPDMEEFLNRGVPILEQIGYALGSFYGNIIGGFASGASSGLPDIGKNVSEFFSNLLPGIDALKNVGSESVTGMGNIAKIIALIGGSAIVTGLSDLLVFGDATAMDVFGNTVSQFAEIMVDFSKAIIGINPESVIAAATAGKALSEMQILTGLSGVLSFFGGGTDLSTFGEQIKAFGEAMVGFSSIVSADGAINTEAIEAAKNAGLIMTELQKAVVPVGGVAQLLSGTQDLREFAEQIKAFGEAIVGFSYTVSQEGAINSTAIEAARNAGLMMTELQKAVVPVGGVAQLLSGTQDLSSFGLQLSVFGRALVDFSSVVSQEGSINSSAIEAAKNAGLIMTELQNAISPTGGVFSFFTGRDSMGYFGEQIKKYGAAIAGFSATVSANGGVNSDAVEAAKNAGLMMAELQKAIPEDRWFDGKVSLDEFGATLYSFGNGIRNFSERVSGLDFTSVNSSLSAAKNLANFSATIVDLDTSGVESFKSLSSIGRTIQDYGIKITGLDFEIINSSIATIRQLVDLIRSMVGLDASGVTSFGDAMRGLGDASATQFITAFDQSSTKLKTSGETLITHIKEGINSKKSELTMAASTLMTETLTSITQKGTEFKNAATSLADQLVSGIEDKRETIKNSFNSALTEAESAVRGFYNLFYNAGSYLVDGFAAGITANTFKAEAKARAMARAAAEAAEEELDINSPSKVGYGIGNYFGIGFVNAIGDYASKAYDASSNMAEKARTGLSDAIGKISDIVNNDVDHTPTIRPVMDLSNIHSGAKTLNDMLHMGASVPVLATVNGINYSMNRNRQNGVNDDVVSAIDRLRRDMGSIGGNSYTVNGITYDDGSSISDAVKSLIRAARIDRRV